MWERAGMRRKGDFQVASRKLQVARSGRALPAPDCNRQLLQAESDCPDYRQTNSLASHDFRHSFSCIIASKTGRRNIWMPYNTSEKSSAGSFVRFPCFIFQPGNYRCRHILHYSHTPILSSTFFSMLRFLAYLIRLETDFSGSFT